MLAVVWLGRDDNQPAGLTGSGGALQVWGDLMADLHPKGWSAPLPENTVWFWIDDQTGRRTDESCPGARRYPFVEGSEPDYRPCQR
jgi:penicillin-binding protein 1B